MYVNQSELFMGTSMDFIKKFMDISQMTSHAKGDILFRETDQVVYEACRVGEAFGWSSLIGGNEYSASAECIESTKLLRTDNEKFKRVLDQDPSSGVIFFKQLASTLGHRLLESYKIISPSA